MCGRTVCTLSPEQVCQACNVLSTNNLGQKQYYVPEWKDHPGKYTYSPSTNIAPSTFTPILFNSRDSSCQKRDVEGNVKSEIEKLQVQPMMWGMIPFFYRGETPYGHGYKTNNCRIEDIEEKKIFKPSLTKGQRCVVLCDGFYEWQTTKGTKEKQPYFIHSPQEKGIEIWNKDTWPKENLWTEDEGWKGGNLLKMAGLYSVWHSSNEDVYSYTVITMESGNNLSWLHNRIPAILQTPKDVKMWLEEEDYQKALSNLTNNPVVSFYTVSKQVNNSRNKDDNLHFPFTEEKKPASAGSKLMAAWLNSAKKETK